MLDLDQFSLILAQDNATGLPGQTTAVPDPGTGPAGGGGGTAASPFGGPFFLVLIGAMVLMLVFSSLAPRRERKKRDAMLSAIRKHDKVQTVGGVIGAIVEIKPDFVVLKVDESSNTRITFARSSIQQVLSSQGEEAPTV